MLLHIFIYTHLVPLVLLGIRLIHTYSHWEESCILMSRLRSITHYCFILSFFQRKLYHYGDGSLLFFQMNADPEGWLELTMSFKRFQK